MRILQRLRGPDLSEVIPLEESDDQQAGLQRLWFGGLAALERIGGMIETYDAFQPDAARAHLMNRPPSRPMDHDRRTMTTVAVSSIPELAIAFASRELPALAIAMATAALVGPGANQRRGCRSHSPQGISDACFHKG